MKWFTKIKPILKFSEKWNEHTHKRNQKSDTYYLPDGSFDVSILISPKTRQLTETEGIGLGSHLKIYLTPLAPVKAISPELFFMTG